MEVKIERRFDLPVRAEQAWALLEDVRATAACMPGAQITEQLDEHSYKGLVRTRIGPASMNFTGQVQVLEKDAASRTLRMLGKGGDTNGSAATMNLTARIEPGASDAVSVLAGETAVTVSGKLAQFGGRFLVPVAESMLDAFAKQFSQQAAAREVAAAPAADPTQAATQPATPADPAPALAPTTLSVTSLVWAAMRHWWAGLFGARR
jgi:carbon monoxide dehydrogenase subunit G